MNLCTCKRLYMTKVSVAERFKIYCYHCKCIRTKKVYSTLHLINNSVIGISSMSVSPETPTDVVLIILPKLTQLEFSVGLFLKTRQKYVAPEPSY